MKPTFLVIILTFLIRGCGTKDIKKVGFIMPQKDRFLKESEFFQKKLIALGCESVILTIDFNEDEQLNIGVSFFNNEYLDLLIIAPINGNTIAPLVRDAKNRGIPVVAYNMLINNVDYDALVTGYNQYLAEVFCKEAIKQYPQGNYVILGGDGFDRNGVELKRGI